MLRLPNRSFVPVSPRGGVKEAGVAHGSGLRALRRGRGAAARALAERELALRKYAHCHVKPFAPEHAAGPIGHHFNKHAFRLETPWRGGA